jgi:hypothetical protein
MASSGVIRDFQTSFPTGELHAELEVLADDKGIVQVALGADRKPLRRRRDERTIRRRASRLQVVP